ncbi:hypothetical protein LWI28_023712 [Acer negundo]|uniref:TF-B3 domain-containing protein n=1 Tax=Acer negundo TaxID=4023 RepID=A0AAD5NEM9_ACENE|nr:hypothetical protein LWI28_023712 [Acer negundo]
MAIASKNRDTPRAAPTKVKRKSTDNMLSCKKEICNNPGNIKCEKQKRIKFEDLYDDEEVKLAVMEQANQVQANLAPQFPSLIKYMLQSHVTRGFWLGLPSKFCLEHLPRLDTIIVLEDEDGNEYNTKYLAEKIGLSAGWRGFSISHKIREGDVAVFHLVSQTKFKVEGEEGLFPEGPEPSVRYHSGRVRILTLCQDLQAKRQSQVYIVRSNGSDEVDGALGLLKLDTCCKQQNSVKDIDIGICNEEEDKYWDPLAQDIPQEIFDKDINMEPMSDYSENESKGAVGSEVLDGITISESTVEFKDVKNIEDFKIVVNGLVINSTLSKHLLGRYYELCCSQSSFLHDRLLSDLNYKLVVGMIAETINIADGIRASSLTTSQSDFATWDKTLKAFQMMGMKVGFLQARLEQLVNFTLKSERSHTARLERARADEARRILDGKLSAVRVEINRLDSEIDTLEGSAIRLAVVFQEVAKAAW